MREMIQKDSWRPSMSKLHVVGKEFRHGSLADEANAHALFLLKHIETTQWFCNDFANMLLVIVPQWHQHVIETFTLQNNGKL